VLILLGVPAVTVALGPLIAVQQRTESHYRDLDGQLTSRATDIASGLGVLAGLGNTRQIADDFESEVLQLRGRGFRVAAASSWVQAATASLPVLLLALVTWLAARLTAQGELSTGELLAVYGYVAVLVAPVSFFIEAIDDLGRGLVGARRAIDFLTLPEQTDAQGSQAAASRGAGPVALSDLVTGLDVPADGMLAVVCHGTDVRALTGRLCGLADPPARRTGVGPAAGGDVVVVAHDDMLFPGTLREMLTTRDGGVSDDAVERALCTAAAEDVVAALPDGLGTSMTANAGTVSGGQRQRLLLARALLHDPAVLVLVDPTSAVDSQTDFTIARRVHEARRGRGTVVVTSSSAFLGTADAVAFVAGERLRARGTHQDLLNSVPEYRATVARSWEEEPDDGL